MYFKNTGKYSFINQWTGKPLQNKYFLFQNIKESRSRRIIYAEIQVYQAPPELQGWT
jgi:hypothetical protein